MKKIFAVICCSVVVAGCASVSEPMRIGPNGYLVNSEMAGMFPSWGEVKQLAIAKANDHCTSQGKIMVLDAEEYSGARGWTPIEAHIKYRCVDQ